MKPGQNSQSDALDKSDRRQFLIAATAVGAGVAATAAISGCATPAVRSQSPEDESESTGPHIRLVEDLAIADNVFPAQVVAVALVNGLPGTGSDPTISPQRASLLDELQILNVVNPQTVLASPDTALVMVRGYLRPGIQEGDRFDLEIRVPERDETTSLRGGWLMETRLTEALVTGQEIRKGVPLAIGQGAVLVDPSASETNNKEMLRRGRILGGGVARKSRPLYLVLRDTYKQTLASAQIGVAINRRFHTFRNGIKEGVANAQTDQRILLDVHPRYKDNVERYINVIRSLPVRESASQQLQRVRFLERQLLDPVSASTAALRLEALGKNGIDTLLKGLAAKDREVQFYSAEALAYLDESVAVKTLGDVAREELAFRAYALTALSAMNDYAAFEALRDLLHVPSAETRYGAFRALWAMNNRDALVQGERLGEFSYHVLNTNGPEMIHVTRSYRPEVVVFGENQRLTAPFVLQAGKRILITARDDNRVTVSAFAPNTPDQKREVSTSVDALIRAIVELDGSYPDVVQVLQQAKSKGVLAGRLEMDAVPQGGRRYYRTKGGEDDAADGQSELVAANPLPGLFSIGQDKERPARPPKPKGEPVEQPGAFKRFFRKVSGSSQESTSEDVGG